MEYEPTIEEATETLNPAETPHPDATAIIEYSYIMDTAQLSSARLLDMPGSLDAKTFKEYLGRFEYDPYLQQEIIERVGWLFDDALISFVTAKLIGRRNQEVIIRASKDDGVNGWMPWEEKLAAHIEKLHMHGILQTVGVHVERYDEELVTLFPSTSAIDTDNSSPEMQA